MVYHAGVDIGTILVFYQLENIGEPGKLRFWGFFLQVRVLCSRKLKICNFCLTFSCAVGYCSANVPYITGYGNFFLTSSLKIYDFVYI
jgi:hypothetical protein